MTIYSESENDPRRVEHMLICTYFVSFKLQPDRNDFRYKTVASKIYVFVTFVHQTHQTVNPNLFDDYNTLKLVLLRTYEKPTWAKMRALLFLGDRRILPKGMRNVRPNFRNSYKLEIETLRGRFVAPSL